MKDGALYGFPIQQKKRSQRVARTLFLLGSILESFYYWDKTAWKQLVEVRASNSLPLCSFSFNSPLRVPHRGTWKQGWSRDPEGTLLTGLISVVCSVRFLKHSGATCPANGGLGHPTPTIHQENEPQNCPQASLASAVSPVTVPLARWLYFVPNWQTFKHHGSSDIWNRKWGTYSDCLNFFPIWFMWSKG